ncbi:MAG: KAP family P-loop NTPase fold protein [Roseimicrobium sp.]
MSSDYLPRPDAPVFDPTEDWLNRKPFLETITRVLAHGQPPLVCGVEGDWGSGKTSILHQAYFTLEGECPQNTGYREEKGIKQAAPGYEHVRTVWFEAWRYQHEPAPIIALLHEMRAQLSSGWKFRAQAAKIGETAIRGAFEMIGDVAKGIAVGMGVTGAAGIPTPRVGSTLQQIGEGIEARRFETPLQSVQIRNYLTTAIQQLLPEKGKPAKDKTPAPVPRLIVMIDDLDRCEPESAFRLLEGIKIYLDLPDCIFLLGINRREIESAIRVVLSKQSSAPDGGDLAYRAHEYVEKLCPVLWRLPVPTHEEKNAFAYKCWSRSAGCQNQMTAALDDYDVLPANPRKIVALCNRIAHLIQATEDLPAKQPGLTEQSAAYRLVLALSCLYQFHPAVYRMLQGNPQFFSEIRRWSDNPKAKNLDSCFTTISAAQSAELDPNAANLQSATTFVDSFIDPIRSDVFRIQRLIRSIQPTESILAQFLAI